MLIVENDADSATMYQVGLAQHGAAVTSAESVPEALALFGRERPDVVVSDLRLPGEDGRALVRAIRRLPAESGGGVPAIALTGESGPDARAGALAAGFDCFCVKPCSPDELVRVIAGVLGRGPQQQAGPGDGRPGAGLRGAL